MNDIKRLSAFLIALSMFVANMTVVVVSADETDIQDAADSITYSDAESVEIAEENSEETLVEETVQDEPNAEPASDEENHEEPVQEVQQEPAQEVQQEPVQEVQQEESSEEQIPENEETPDMETQEEVPAGETEASAINKGKGDLEGLVNTKVFQVTLPVEGNNLDYVADPQGLIAKTEAAKHPDSLYDSGSNVYFNNGEIISEDGRKVTSYSGVSNPLTVVNKSSCAVSIVARVSAYYEQGITNPVAIAGDKNWENVKRPSIYLSVIKSDDMSEVVLTQREKVITSSVPGCPGAYHYVYENGSGGEAEYQYKLMSDDELAAFRSDEANAGVDTTFKEFSLSMTGECNSEGEWDDKIEYDFPSTSIVWNVGFAVSAKPCINTVDYSVSYSSAIDIPYSLGAFDSAATGFISAEYISPDGENMQLLENDAYMRTTDEVITLTSELAYYAHTREGGIVRFRFNDPAETVIDVTLDNNAAPSLDSTECSVSSGESKIIITYNLGVGNKAASGVSGVSFGSTDFSSSAYSSIRDGKIVLNAGAVRTIQMKNGGKVYVTFDDPNHTRCGIKVNVD